MRRPCSTVERAEALVLGPDAADGAAGGVPLADLGDGAAKLRADGLDERGLLLDGDGIIDGEADVAAGGISSGLRAGLAAEDDGDIGANGLEMLLLVDVEADAETDEQNHRGDAPHDAEHGEEAAELCFPERGQRLLEDLVERHGGT